MNSKNNNQNDSFEKYIEDYCEEYAKYISADCENPEDRLDGHVFSKNYEKWFKDLVDGKIDPMTYNQKPVRRINIKKIIMNVAAAIYILGATFLVVGFSVPPIRNAVLNYYIDAKEDSYDISADDNNIEDIYETDLDSVVSTPIIEEPTDDSSLYPKIPLVNIPEGFILTESVDQGYIAVDTYENADEYITINKYESSPTISFDIDLLHEHKIINDIEIDVFYDDSINYVIFVFNDYFYNFESNIQKDQVIEIVKSIIK